MGTRLIHELAIALADDGYRVVRFNFRGVGRSEGSYDRGVGETEDARIVYEALLRESGKPPMIVGFSFGGAIAVRIAGHADAPRLVCIATPARVRDSELEPSTDAANVHCPTHLIYGNQDELVTRADAEALAAGFPETPQWHVLDGADHFLTPTHLSRAVAATRKALAEQHL